MGGFDGMQADRPAICVVDAAGVVRHACARARRLFGDSVGTALSELLDGSLPECPGRALLGELVVELEPFGDGALCTISERRAWHEPDSGYLDALGQFAGEVAHDFGNLLAAIRISAEAAMDEIDAGRSAREDIEQALEAVRMAIDLNADLSAFGRRGALALREFDLNRLALDLRPVLSKLAGRCTLRVETCPRPLLCRIDKARLTQALMNLTTNARDAMATGGEIEIILSDRAHDGAPTNCATISVSDAGTGMPHDVAQRAFEPLFTTKAEGTGLGLSLVYGLVAQLGGSTALRTELGKGTEVEIRVPLLQKVR